MCPPFDDWNRDIRGESWPQVAPATRCRYPKDKRQKLTEPKKISTKTRGIKPSGLLFYWPRITSRA